MRIKCTQKFKFITSTDEVRKVPLLVLRNCDFNVFKVLVHHFNFHFNAIKILLTVLSGLLLGNPLFEA